MLAWNFALAIHISANSQVLYVVYKRQILLTTGKSNEAKQSNKTELEDVFYVITTWKMWYGHILFTVFSPIELDPNKTFFTNRTRIFKKIKSGFSLFH